MEVRDERRLLRFQKQMAGYKLLIIDELGFVPLSKTGAELLFEMISQRYERGSTLITSNLPFDERTETFGSERLTGALLDRDLAEAQDPAVEVKRQRLEQLQGVGGAASSVMAREVFARSFASRRHLASYLGLTPSAYDSGSVTRCQGISKAGNSWSRRILIEISWLWLRYQPKTALAQWYGQRTRGQGQRVRRVMLVALARKLAVVLWRYVETGALPHGATLSRYSEAGEERGAGGVGSWVTSCGPSTTRAWR